MNGLETETWKEPLNEPKEFRRDSKPMNSTFNPDWISLVLLDKLSIYLLWL